jgi:hypothetical protein
MYAYMLLAIKYTCDCNWTACSEVPSGSIGATVTSTTIENVTFAAARAMGAYIALFA